MKLCLSLAFLASFAKGLYTAAAFGRGSLHRSAPNVLSMQEADKFLRYIFHVCRDAIT
jgi:hypothetical protein